MALRGGACYFATWSPAEECVALVFSGLTIMRMYINIPGLPAQIYDMFPYICYDTCSCDHKYAQK